MPARKLRPEAQAQGLDGQVRLHDRQTQVLQQFRIVINAVKSHWQEVERKSGIGGAQVWALSVIHAHPGIGVNGLAAALSVAQPTASYMVRHLSRQGFVDGRREGADKRAVQLHATSAGAEVLARTPGPFSGVLPQALARIDAQTLERLHLDLHQLICVLNADAEDAETPLART